MKVKELIKKMKCKEYHDWEVISVNGTLPYQEVELKCKNCQVERDIISFDYNGDKYN